MLVDAADKLYVRGRMPDGADNVHVSEDFGETWRVFGELSRLFDRGQGYIANADRILLDPAKIVLSDRWSIIWPRRFALGDALSGDWREPGDTPSGPPYSIAWDGTRVWATAGRPSTWDETRRNHPPRFSLFRSPDTGYSWSASPLPYAAVPHFGTFGRPYVSAVGGGRVLLFGGQNNTFLLDQVEWQLIHGGGTLGGFDYRNSGRPSIAVDARVGPRLRFGWLRRVPA